MWLGWRVDVIRVHRGQPGHRQLTTCFSLPAGPPTADRISIGLHGKAQRRTRTWWSVSFMENVWIIIGSCISGSNPLQTNDKLTLRYTFVSSSIFLTKGLLLQIVGSAYWLFYLRAVPIVECAGSLVRKTVTRYRREQLDERRSANFCRRIQVGKVSCHFSAKWSTS